MPNKTYCVHIYPRPTEYENITATSPEKAKEKVLALGEWPDWNEIENIEVMRQCVCGLDNDLTNKLCENCGTKL